jgi:hypothetical protein
VRRVLVLVLMVVASGVAATGCGSHGTPSMYGTVTTLSPRLCIGAHAATGQCFVADRAQLTEVQVGECVKATWQESTSGPALRLVSIEAAAVSEHGVDCPNG